MDPKLRRARQWNLCLGASCLALLVASAILARGRTGGLAPEGRHLVTLAHYRGHRPDGGDELDPDRTRRLLLDHARAMGVDLDRVEMERYLHRLTVTGGMPVAARGGMAGRPGVAFHDGIWHLVVASLTSLAEADRTQNRFRELGFAVTRKTVIRRGRTLHRLLLPGFESIDAALEARAGVEARLGVRDAWVWKAGG